MPATTLASHLTWRRQASSTDLLELGKLAEKSSPEARTRAAALIPEGPRSRFPPPLAPLHVNASAPWSRDA